MRNIKFLLCIFLCVICSSTYAQAENNIPDGKWILERLEVTDSTSNVQTYFLKDIDKSEIHTLFPTGLDVKGESIGLATNKQGTNYGEGKASVSSNIENLLLDCSFPDGTGWVLTIEVMDENNLKMYATYLSESLRNIKITVFYKRKQE